MYLLNRRHQIGGEAWLVGHKAREQNSGSKLRLKRSTGGAAPSAMQRLIELIDDPNPPVELMAAE